MDDLSPLRGWYSLTGRRARLSYFLASLAAFGVACAGLIVGLGMSGFGENTGWALAPGIVLMLATIVFAIVTSYFLLAQRARDIGWNVTLVVIAWVTLTIAGGASNQYEELSLVISLINIAFALVLLFMPSRNSTLELLPA